MNDDVRIGFEERDGIWVVFDRLHGEMVVSEHATRDAALWAALEEAARLQLQPQRASILER